jgi:DNA-binding transcriptional LysR family regulator
MIVDGLDGLGAFLHVAATSSFTAAAKATGLSPSAVSHTIRQLEAKLEVRLFNRTTRSVSLTEAGTELYERVAPLMNGLQTAVRQVSKSASRPAGLLRLNVPRSASIVLIEPVLRDFLDAYPDVSLELVIDNGLSDIVRQGFDAGIRFGNVLEKDMHAVPVRPAMRVAIVASPDYLARRGRPASPEDLQEHDCMAFRGTTSGTLYPWDLEKDGERRQIHVRGRFIANDSLLMLQGALDGVGLAYLYEEYVERFVQSGHLVRVMEDWSPCESLHLYFFNPRGMPPKLRVFIDFLMEANRAPALRRRGEPVARLT